MVICGVEWQCWGLVEGNPMQYHLLVGQGEFLKYSCCYDRALRLAKNSVGDSCTRCK